MARTVTSRQSVQFRIASWPLPPCQSCPAAKRARARHRSVLPCADTLRPAPHCPHASAYKTDPHAICLHPQHFLPPVSCHRRASALFRHAIGAEPPHPPSVLVCRSRSEARTPSSRTGAAPVSFRLFVARPPSYELVLLAMSSGFAVHLGCSR
jgi:hypothetical protein